MKASTAVILFFLILLAISCRTKTTRVPVEYIKVITLTNADSLTQFNKGWSLGEFFHLTPRDNSLLYRSVSYSERATADHPYTFTTYTGTVPDTMNLDPLVQLVHLMQRHPNGDITDTSRIDSDAIYCGPSYHIELKDAKGLHHYSFTLDGNDTLTNFSDFFGGFKRKKWKQARVDNTILNPDSVAVAALRNVGQYEHLPCCFLGSDCEPAIDFSALYGVWRSLSNLAHTDTNYYRLLTLGSDGVCKNEAVKKGRDIVKLHQSRFLLNRKDSTLELEFGSSGRKKYKITKLTTHCLEFTTRGDDYGYKYSKI